METEENSKTENHKFNVIPVPESEVVNFGTANKYSCYVCSKPFGVYEAPSFCPHCGIKQNDETAIEFVIERKINEHIDDVMSPDLKGVDLEFVQENFPDYELSFKRARAILANECEDRDPGVDKIVVPFIRELAEKIAKIGSEEAIHVPDLFAAYAELISQVLWPPCTINKIEKNTVEIPEDVCDYLSVRIAYIGNYMLDPAIKIEGLESSDMEECIKRDIKEIGDVFFKYYMPK